MQYYESIYILNPELSSEENQKIQENFSDIVSKQGGEVHVVDDWGTKRLAYEVKKQKKGHFVLMQFAASAATLQELERNYRVNDGVIKYMTLCIDKNKLQVVIPKKPEDATTEGQPKPDNEETGE